MASLPRQSKSDALLQCGLFLRMTASITRHKSLERGFLKRGKLIQRRSPRIRNAKNSRCSWRIITQVFFSCVVQALFQRATATLPHEKYYHMEAYERRMTALRAGEYVPPPDDAYDPTADMRAHATKHKKSSTEQDSYLNREQLMELRKVQNERIEVCFSAPFHCGTG